MRVLVTGASGLLGGRLAKLLSSHHQVVAGHHRSPTPDGLAETGLDLNSKWSIEAALKLAQPDAVVHAAALANADQCAREPDLAWRLNVEASELLARLCQSGGLRLVALSTDLVFDGLGSLVPETHHPEPHMVYGRTKAEAERAVLARAPGAAVARVALVHGRGFGPRPTASEAVAWALRQGRRPRLFTDQYRTPVDPESVASAIDRLLGLSSSGIFHLGGPERVSRYELGVRVARRLGLSPALIEAVRQTELSMGQPRPADVSLDSSRAVRELEYAPRPLEQAISEGRQQSEVDP